MKCRHAITTIQPAISMNVGENRKPANNAAAIAILVSQPPMKKAGATRVVSTAAGTAFSAASTRGGMRVILVIEDVAADACKVGHDGGGEDQQDHMRVEIGHGQTS